MIELVDNVTNAVEIAHKPSDFGIIHIVARQCWDIEYQIAILDRKRWYVTIDKFNFTIISHDVTDQEKEILNYNICELAVAVEHKNVITTYLSFMQHYNEKVIMWSVCEGIASTAEHRDQIEPKSTQNKLQLVMNASEAYKYILVEHQADIFEYEGCLHYFVPVVTKPELNNYEKNVIAQWYNEIKRSYRNCDIYQFLSINALHCTTTQTMSNDDIYKIMAKDSICRAVLNNRRQDGIDERNEAKNVTYKLAYFGFVRNYRQANNDMIDFDSKAFHNPDLQNLYTHDGNEVEANEDLQTNYATNISDMLYTLFCTTEHDVECIRDQAKRRRYDSSAFICFTCIYETCLAEIKPEQTIVEVQNILYDLYDKYMNYIVKTDGAHDDCLAVRTDLEMIDMCTSCTYPIAESIPAQ